MNLYEIKQSIQEAIDKCIDMETGEIINPELLETAKVVVSFRKSKSIDIQPNANIPDEFLIIQEPKPDKAGLKKAIQAGAVINGVSIVEKSNISIK